MIAVELLGHRSHVCKSPVVICFGIGALVLSPCDGAFLEKVEKNILGVRLG